MTAKMPPIPEENRSPKGTGDQGNPGKGQHMTDDAATDPDKRGQQGNTKVNTTHQGIQHDR